MKKALLFLSIFIASSTHAGIGKHNFLFSLMGGPGLYYDQTKLSASDNTLIGLPTVDKINVKGSVGFEIGYLLHSVRESGTVHGLDIRAGVMGDIPTKGYSLDVHEYRYNNGSSYTTYNLSNPVLLNFSVDYTPGIQLQNYRLMFDVIGTGIALAFANSENTETGSKGLAFNLGYRHTLPLGTHFVFNNGFYFATRHHLTINPFTQSSKEAIVKYNIMFHLGFVFGK
ncbi:MAG: hypothetical protein ACRCS8_01260 [Brevinema sp.]